MFAEFKFGFKNLVLLIFDMCIFAYVICNMAINLPKMNLTNLDVFLVSLMGVATFYFMMGIVRPFIDKMVSNSGKDK
ncbi:MULTISPECIES: hypothetical protein [Bacillus]|uniref:hypothetical protein n=1 Tax=Bacillus TaxID=1386 RepID=UPI001912A8A7|nr:hypothetical protein [Bacillus sp. TH13]MBK5491705.1 hypothetical protein [Bacillus sp. TH13]